MLKRLFVILCLQQIFLSQCRNQSQPAMESLKSSGFKQRFYNILIVGTNGGLADVNQLFAIDLQGKETTVFTLNRDFTQFEHHTECHGAGKILANRLPALGKEQYMRCIGQVITARMKLNAQSSRLPNAILQSGGGKVEVHAYIEAKMQDIVTIFNSAFKSILQAIGKEGKIGYIKQGRNFLCKEPNLATYLLGQNSYKVLCKGNFLKVIGFIQDISVALDNAKHLAKCVKFKVRARGQLRYGSPGCRSADCVNKAIQNGYGDLRQTADGSPPPNSLYHTCEGYVKEQEQPVYGQSFQRDFYTAEAILEIFGYLSSLRTTNLDFYKAIVTPIYQLLTTTVPFEKLEGIIGDAINKAQWRNGYADTRVVMWDGAVKVPPHWGSSAPHLGDRPPKNFVTFYRGKKELWPNGECSGYAYSPICHVYMPTEEKNNSSQKFGKWLWVLPPPVGCQDCAEALDETNLPGPDSENQPGADGSQPQQSENETESEPEPTPKPEQPKPQPISISELDGLDPLVPDIVVTVKDPQPSESLTCPGSDNPENSLTILATQCHQTTTISCKNVLSAFTGIYTHPDLGRKQLVNGSLAIAKDTKAIVLRSCKNNRQSSLICLQSGKFAGNLVWVSGKQLHCQP